VNAVFEMASLLPYIQPTAMTRTGLTPHRSLFDKDGGMYFLAAPYTYSGPGPDERGPPPDLQNIFTFPFSCYQYDRDVSDAPLMA